jgi:AraC family L-rhamnose operon transcriptional activator RhaR
MSHSGHIRHLTVRNTFLHADAPFAIYRHQVDGDHFHGRHDHDFIELVMISGGRGWQTTPYGNLPLRRGSLFVLHPGVWHAYVDCEELLVNVCAIDCRLFDFELGWLRDNPAIAYILWGSAITLDNPRMTLHCLPPQGVSRCSRAFYTLQESESKTTSQARVEQIGLMTTFLAEMADCVSLNMPIPVSGAAPAVARAETPHNDVVKRTMLMFSENLARSWSIRELSGSFGLSTPHYIRLFKREMGESPLSYLSGMRARRAAELLMYGESSVAQVGIDVGWEDPGYFSRRFRQYFGSSPRAYRRAYRRFDDE